jgi:hypothetical protein
VVTSSPFDLFIMIVIVANVLLMACDYWKIEDDTFYHSYTAGMQIFSYIYYAEATLKITGLGGFYFRDSWCRFDFFLVCTTLLDQFGSELLEQVLPLPPMLLRVLRVFRILRILRLLKDKRAKGVRDLLMTLVLSAPSLANIGSLLLLLMGMYAVLGVQLFTFVIYGELLTEDRNFESFGNALLLLFQVLTGDDWAALMDDCAVTPKNSRCTLEAGNCGSWAAIPYFVSFQLLGSFVLLNLVVAIILENFTTLGNVNPDLISSADIANFTEAWAEFDPDADGDILTKDLPKLLLKVPPPMGFQGQLSKEQLQKMGFPGEKMSPEGLEKFCKSHHIKEYSTGRFGGGEIHFQDVIDALVKKNFGSGLEEGLPALLAVPDVPPEVAEMAEGFKQNVGSAGCAAATTAVAMASRVTVTHDEQMAAAHERLGNTFPNEKMSPKKNSKLSRFLAKKNASSELV